MGDDNPSVHTDYSNYKNPITPEVVKNYRTNLGSNISAPYLKDFYPYGETNPLGSQNIQRPLAFNPSQQPQQKMNSWFNSNNATKYLTMRPYTKPLTIQ
jgi:hypothetical protein